MLVMMSYFIPGALFLYANSVKRYLFTIFYDLYLVKFAVIYTEFKLNSKIHKCNKSQIHYMLCLHMNASYSICTAFSVSCYRICNE